MSLLHKRESKTGAVQSGEFTTSEAASAQSPIHVSGCVWAVGHGAMTLSPSQGKAHDPEVQDRAGLSMLAAEGLSTAWFNEPGSRTEAP